MSQEVLRVMLRNLDIKERIERPYLFDRNGKLKDFKVLQSKDAYNNTQEDFCDPN